MSLIFVSALLPYRDELLGSDELMTVEGVDPNTPELALIRAFIVFADDTETAEDGVTEYCEEKLGVVPRGFVSRVVDMDLLPAKLRESLPENRAGKILLDLRINIGASVKDSEAHKKASEWAFKAWSEN